MGFKQYLKEIAYEKQFKILGDEIEKNCKPFLKHKRIIYRGMEELRGEASFGKNAVRQDRIGRGKNPNLSTYVNTHMKEKGLPDRTKSIFGITNQLTSNVFGESTIIFPKGNYKSVYFHNLSDMNSFKHKEFKDFLKTLKSSVLKGMSVKEQRDYIEEEIENLDSYHPILGQFYEFNSILGSYDTKNFPPPAVSGEVTSEIVIECKEYYYATRRGYYADKLIERFGLV